MIQAILTPVATLQAVISQAPMIVNDWVISIEGIDGGYRLSARRGSEIQSIDVPFYPDAFGAVSPGNAGKLLYVDGNGYLQPVTLGDGLSFVDGVLSVTGSIAENIEFVVDDVGNVIINGAGFDAEADGVVVLDDVAFEVQDDETIVLVRR